MTGKYFSPQHVKGKKDRYPLWDEEVAFTSPVDQFQTISPYNRSPTMKFGTGTRSNLIDKRVELLPGPANYILCMDLA
jgi:hypothetical protein